jgi:hypothetical protein
MSMVTRFVLAFLVAGNLALLSASGPVLGVVSAAGDFRVNSSTVSGNATLFDGALVETARFPSRIRLESGTRIQLSPNSRARVFQDRLILEKGYSDFAAPGKYRIVARTLAISPATKDAVARVALHGAKMVQVAAAKGAVRVYAASGILVSNVEPGIALDFEPQVEGPSAPSTFIGCLLRKDGKFILYDQTTRMIIELRGTGFEKEWGNRVQVNGTASSSSQPEGGTVQVLDVTSITRIGEGGCEPVAEAIRAELPPAPAKPPASKPAPPPRTGMSAGTKVAIAAAVIGGGVGGAVAATQLGKSPRSND